MYINLYVMSHSQVRERERERESELPFVFTLAPPLVPPGCFLFFEDGPLTFLDVDEDIFI